MSKLVFFYGTLKIGHYNHRRFFNDDSSFLNNDIVDGLGLVRLEGLPYPHAVPDFTSHIVGEVHRVDEGVYKNIEMMELGAGYSVKEVVTRHGRVCSIFYSEDHELKKLPKFSFFAKRGESSWL